MRLRLTLLYGGLFLVSGIVLLAITYLLVRHSTGNLVLFRHQVGPATPVDPGQPLPVPTEMLERTRELRSAAAGQRAEVLNQLLAQAAIALGFMSAVSVALGWIVAGRVIRPLEQAYDAQRRFVANASHELRTPLAMMRTSVDVATGKPGGAPAGVDALGGKVREGLDQADRLLESFLSLARAQHDALPDRAAVPLADVVTEAVAARGDAIAAMGIAVERADGDARVIGSRTLLARMVENVVDNAVRHNQPSGWMRVETRVDGGRAAVVIENGGPVLAPDDVEQVARPFGRLGPDRTGSEHGVGLGLSIVAAIAAAHRGRMELAARPEGGLRVRIELPAG